MYTLHKIGKKIKIQLKRDSLLIFSFSSSNFLCKSKVVRHWASVGFTVVSLTEIYI